MCAFGVMGKFIGLIIRSMGTKVDTTKIKAIVELRQRTYGNICMMEKDLVFKLDQQCQGALESIKTCLTKPPVLASPIRGKPSILYIIAFDYSLLALYKSRKTLKEENALYYISRTLSGPEERYSLSRSYALH